MNSFEYFLNKDIFFKGIGSIKILDTTHLLKGFKQL